MYGVELDRVATCMMQGDVQKLRRQDEEVGGTENATVCRFPPVEIEEFCHKFQQGVERWSIMGKILTI